MMNALNGNNFRGGRGRGRGGFRPKRCVFTTVEAVNSNPTKSEESHYPSLLLPKTIFNNPLLQHNARVVKPSAAPKKQNLAKVIEKNKSASKNGGLAKSIADKDTDDEERCDFCGKSEHRSRFCTIFNEVKLPPADPSSCCFYCKLEGHYKMNCPKMAAHRNQTSRVASWKNQTKREMTKTYSHRGVNCTNGAEENSVASWPAANSNSKSNQQHKRIFVPMPVPASSIKPVVQLRSQLKSNDSSNPPSCSNDVKKKQGKGTQAEKSSTSYCRSDSDESVTNSTSFSSSSTDLFPGNDLKEGDKSEFPNQQITQVGKPEKTGKNPVRQCLQNKSLKYWDQVNVSSKIQLKNNFNEIDEKKNPNLPSNAKPAFKEEKTQTQTFYANVSVPQLQTSFKDTPFLQKQPYSRSNSDDSSLSSSSSKSLPLQTAIVNDNMATERMKQLLNISSKSSLNFPVRSNKVKSSENTMPNTDAKTNSIAVKDVSKNTCIEELNEENSLLETITINKKENFLETLQQRFSATKTNSESSNDDSSFTSPKICVDFDSDTESYEAKNMIESDEDVYGRDGAVLDQDDDELSVDFCTLPTSSTEILAPPTVVLPKIVNLINDEEKQHANINDKHNVYKILKNLNG